MRWFLLVLALTIGSAWSNDPIPIKDTTSPQQQTKHAKKPAAKDQRGTEKQPLVVKIENAPKAETDAPKDKEQSSQQSPFIWGMTAEELGAIATCLLVVVGALTALILICQSYFLRRSIKDAAEKTKIDIALKLPIVVLDEMQLLQADNRYPAIQGVTPERSTFTITFRNHGETPAIVTHIFAQHIVAPELPPEPRYTVGGSMRAGFVIPASGGTRQHDPMLNIILSEAQRNDIAANVAHLWIYGVVGFRDVLGNPHVSGFCERWLLGEGGTINGFAEDGPDSYHRNQ